MGSKDLDLIEREVRRRLADLLASAGVDQGRISQEILWQLPPELVRAYRALWERALRSELGSGLEGTDPASASKAKNPSDSKTGGATRQGWSRGASKGAGKKRYSNHWVVADERLFRVKASIDRKLKRLAAEIELQMDRNLDEEERESELGSLARAGAKCPRCHLALDLDNLPSG